MIRKRMALLSICAFMMVCGVTASYAGQWKRDNRGWWYVNDKGTYPRNAWQQIDGKWYCFDGIGYMLHDTWAGDYYLGSDGAMLTNTTTPDGYYVGADGKYIAGSGKVVSEAEKKAKIAAYDYEALIYAGEYRGGAGYEVQFSAYTSVELGDDEIGVVDVFYDHQKIVDYQRMHICFDAGFLSNTNYNEIYVSRHGGQTDYYCFYVAGGQYYLDYYRGQTKLDTLIRTRHFVS